VSKPMLPSLNAAQVYYEEPGQSIDLARFWEVARRRIIYFLVPFFLVAGVGSFIVAIQRPIYLAEGKILIEAQNIPVDLVPPTVTDRADQRIQLIQEGLLARDKVLAIVDKLGLFLSQRQWMSESQLLQLFRRRTKLSLVDPTRSPEGDNAAISMVVGFEYEDPELSLTIANQFVSTIINEDARTRVARAAETTEFLAREVDGLEADLNTVRAQISELKRKPRPSTAASDQLTSQLTTLRAELVQKAAIYSDAHPDVRALKRKIVGLEQTLASFSVPAPGDGDVEALEKRAATIEKRLEEPTRKLAAARLGENLERNQYSERLQVIEQPTLPQSPVRPKRLKWLAYAFALAGIAGVGSVFLAETVDKSIRTTDQLGSVVDSNLVVAIPYLSTTMETVRNKARFLLIICVIAVVIAVIWTTAHRLGPHIDLASLMDRQWADMFRAWADYLTELSK
jgi:uncharacterized protein involved in exopolysaccharide biosynthesis